MPGTLHLDPQGNALLMQIATRVAATRKARGLPRRVLSERSGVSPRYLAQLEAGEPSTYARLLARFHTVWIRTSAPEHMRRVRAQGDVRPMQGNPAAMAQLQELLTIRTPLYSKAEAQLDTTACAESSSLKDLLEIIETQGFLGVV